MRRRLAALGLAAVLLAMPAARADQTDPRLDGLFAALRAAGGADEARPLEARIWEIWIDGGDDEANGLMAVGITAMNEGDLDRAQDIFDRLVRLRPRFAEAWNKRATVLYLRGRFADSIHDIDQVLALEPRHFGALSGLGLCEVRLDHDKAALDAFRRAAAVDPNLSGVRENIEALRKKLERESI